MLARGEPGDEATKMPIACSHGTTQNMYADVTTCPSLEIALMELYLTLISTVFAEL